MSDKRYNTKSIVEAGLMAAMIVIIFLINTYMPLFSYIVLFILSIPITLLYLRHDFKIAISTVAVSAVIISMVANPVSAIGSIFLYGSSGLVLGYCIKNNKGALKTFLLLTGAMLVGTIIDSMITIYMFYGNSLTTLIEENIRMIKEGMDSAVGMYNSMGVDTNSMGAMMDQINSMTPETIMLMIPSILILTAGCEAYLNYIISRKIIKRFNYEMPGFKPFNQWYIDSRVGASMIAVMLLCSMISGKSSIGQYGYVTTTYVLRITATIIGISVIYNWLLKRGAVNKLILFMLIVFSFLNPLIAQIMYLIGITDFILDYRRLDPNSLLNDIRERRKRNN